MKRYLTVLTTVLLFLQSCTKPGDNEVIADTLQSDSVSLLSFTGGAGFLYNTDTLPYKIFSVVPGSGIVPDSTYIYYNPDKTINRLMAVGQNQDYIPVRYKIYHLPIYTQGKISKIYTKRRVTAQELGYNDPAFGNTVGPLSPYTHITSYDSLVYDNSGRLIKNYHYNSENAPSGGYRFYLVNYDVLDYYNPYTNTDSLLFSVKLYDRFGVFTNVEIQFKEYDLNKINPLYKTFKEIALFRNVLHIWKYYPPQYTIGELDRYVSLNPYPLKKLYASTVGQGTVWEDFILYNTFDVYGNLVSSSYSSIYSSGFLLGYNYIRRKK